MRISDWSSDVCSSDLLIFAAVARRLPEILIAVRDLRERAFVQFDGLGEVEDDPVAPGFEHRLDDPQHLVASDQCGRMLRTAQQDPEALRARDRKSTRLNSSH